jgi:hypothetical protein
MVTSIQYEGHAIVSEDGMIADAQGDMPATLRSEADWRYFQAALDRAALVVLGRKGHARHPNPGRRRLVLTTGVAALEPDAADPLASLWNPSGMPLDAALAELGITSGTVAVTGGTGTFDIFLPLYSRFVLAEVRGLALPGGVPCFGKGHPRYVLPGAGLAARDMQLIERNVVQTTWERPAPNLK